ncbi:hypothetical protein GGI12_005638 [Dipsacomyces acuminosporus]|nr:hypothetical protein GGI12_005638 [Dipsacomyces acuminosporus]
MDTLRIVVGTAIGAVNKDAISDVVGGRVTVTVEVKVVVTVTDEVRTDVEVVVTVIVGTGVAATIVVGLGAIVVVMIAVVWLTAVVVCVVETVMIQGGGSGVHSGVSHSSS